MSETSKQVQGLMDRLLPGCTQWTIQQLRDIRDEDVEAALSHPAYWSYAVWISGALACWGQGSRRECEREAERSAMDSEYLEEPLDLRIKLWPPSAEAKVALARSSDASKGDVDV
jgi:hypothetical protein